MSTEVFVVPSLRSPFARMDRELQDFDALVQRLEQRGIAYTRSRSGRRAIFCRDPDGNALELMQIL